MKDITLYINESIVNESADIRDAGVTFEMFKTFFDVWITSEDTYASRVSDDERMDAYNNIISALRKRCRNYDAVMKSLDHFCTYFLCKLNSCGVYDITDEILRLMYEHICKVPLNRIERICGAGEEGMVIDCCDRVIKVYYNDKMPDDKKAFYQLCRSKRYADVLPAVEKIGRNFVIIEKLSIASDKCNEYEYYIDKLYHTVYDGHYDINDFNDDEREVISWLERLRTALSEIGVNSLGDMKSENFGEDKNSNIKFFDL